MVSPVDPRVDQTNFMLYTQEDTSINRYLKEDSMKKILPIAIIFLLALSTLAIFKDALIKSTVTVATTAITGAPTKIDHLSLGLLKQSILIKGFKMYNPAGFPKEILIDIPTIEVSLDVADLFKRKLHFKKIELDLKEVGVIKNKEGKLNVESLKVMEEAGKKEKKPTTESTPKSEKSQELPLQIDELILNLGKIVYRDYTVGETPSVQVYDLGIKGKTYVNIKSAQQLITLIMAEALKPTAIQSAKVYAANAILGAGFLPAGVAITLMGKDSAQEDYDIPYAKVYATTLATLKEIGAVKSENETNGSIKALVDKNDVSVEVKKLNDKTTRLKVSARRLLLPKPEAAGGVALQISEKLKK